MQVAIANTRIKWDTHGGNTMHPLNVRYRAVVEYMHYLPSIRAVAMRYGVGKSTLSRWYRSLEPKIRRRKPRKSVHEKIGPVIHKAIGLCPYTTADDLISLVQSSLGMKTSRSSVYRSLKRLGTTYKHSSRCRASAPIDHSHPFMVSNLSYSGAPISFDESSFYWDDRPRKGWAPSGCRVHRSARKGGRKRVSLLLAVDENGVVASQLLSGGVKSEAIVKFFSMLPDGRPIILDNASIHRTKIMKDLCSRKALDLRYTPPYSPWYNPVEFCFSEIKARYRPLRLKRTPDFESDVDACVRALKHSQKYFKHASEEWSKDRASI